MILRILVCLVLWLGLAQPALACRYEPLAFDAAVEKAEKAFIGTVKNVENGLVTWAVETSVKGLRDGEPFASEIGGESCDIRFQPGERWMYLGPTQPSGSLLLQDTSGARMEENYKIVNDRFSGAAKPVRKTLALTGTLERDCAPWDGSAYTIRLSNGLVASVYASINDLEHKDRKDAAVFPADGKAERNHGQILRCPKIEGHSDIPCQSLRGAINMGPIDSQTAHGSIDITGDGHSTRLLFEVKRIHKQVFCG